MLELRAPDGARLGGATLPGSVSGGVAAEEDVIASVGLLRDGSGALRVGLPRHGASGEETPVTFLPWQGAPATVWIPGKVAEAAGFGLDVAFARRADGSLVTLGANARMQVVDMDGQRVGPLAWAGDDTLRLLHGNATFVAESYLDHRGEPVAQWVTRRDGQGGSFGGGRIGPALRDFHRSGALSAEWTWSGGRRSTHLSAHGVDAAVVVSLEGAQHFAPRVYPWPDGATYSPDMRWVLETVQPGQFRIRPAQPLSEPEATAALAALAP